MFEHVGAKRMGFYFATLFGYSRPADASSTMPISTPGGSKMAGRTFMNRYVFPDEAS